MTTGYAENVVSGFTFCVVRVATSMARLVVCVCVCVRVCLAGSHLYIYSDADNHATFLSSDGKFKHVALVSVDYKPQPSLA